MAGNLLRENIEKNNNDTAAGMLQYRISIRD